jgi:outer membrane protein
MRISTLMLATALLVVTAGSGPVGAQTPPAPTTPAPTTPAPTTPAPTTPAPTPPPAVALATLIATADERNPTIAAARQAVQAAEARIAIARSGRGPTFSATAGVGTSGGGTSTTSGFSTSVGVGATYTIYDGGANALAVKQAEAGLRSARLALDVARQDTSQTVALTYVNVLRAERSVEQRDQEVKRNQELVRVAEGQFRAGVVPRADVVRAQAGLAAAEGELIAARNAVDQTKAVLNAAVGVAPMTAVSVAPAPVAPPLTVAAANLATLVEERAEVKRAQVDIESAETALALAQVSNSLRVGLDGRVSQGITPNSQTTYSIGSTISVPISDAGRQQASVAEATANLAAAKSRVEAVRLSATQQAVTAYLSILDARARVTSARAGLTFAQESLRLAQGRFQAGAGPLLEVIDAQTALIQAEVALARAEFDEVAGVIALRYALGRSVVTGTI